MFLQPRGGEAISEAGHHVQRQVEIVAVSLDVANVEDVGLRQMGRVFLEAFCQRDGGEPR